MQVKGKNGVVKKSRDSQRFRAKLADPREINEEQNSTFNETQNHYNSIFINLYSIAFSYNPTGFSIYF